MADPKEVVVSTRLVIDDQSSEVLKRVQGEYKNTAKTQRELEREMQRQQRREAASQKQHMNQTMGAIVESEKLRVANKRQQANDLIAQEQRVRDSGQSFASQFAATFLAVNLLPAIHQVKDFATEAFELAVAANESRRAMTGLISGVQGVPWAIAAREARDLDEQLEQVAIDSGKLKREVEGGFEAIVSMMGGTETAFNTARQEITDIALIAQKTGHQVTELGDDFGAMAAGIIKPRSELFNLLKATGVFGSDVRKIREEWGKLTEKERIDRLVAGVGQVAGNLKSVEPTFRDLATTMATIKDISIEEFGKSMIAEVLPGFKALTGDIAGSREQIKEYAQELGRDVGRWVSTAVKHARDAFFYLKNHATEIKAALVEAFGYAKSVFEFILAHKEAIAVAFGVKSLATSGLVASVARAGAGGAVAGGLGSLAGAAGAAAAVAALAAAIGGLGLAAHQAFRLFKETGGGKTDDMLNFEAIKRQMEDFAGFTGTYGKKEQGFLNDRRQRFVDMADQLGIDSRAMGEYFDSLVRQHDALRDIVGPLEESARALEQARMAAEASGEGFGVDVGQQDEVIGNIMAEFQAAVAGGKTRMAQQIAQIIAGSTQLQQALLESGGITAEALQTFADNLGDKNADFKAKLEALATSTAKLEKPQVSNNFYGGQTFKIQQDFRDEDPDRVAFFFQRDVSRMAARRSQAGSSAPFGT